MPPPWAERTLGAEREEGGMSQGREGEGGRGLGHGRLGKERESTKQNTQKWNTNTLEHLLSPQLLQQLVSPREKLVSFLFSCSG